MSEPSPRQALQQRVAAAILDGAARIFALQGEQASMNDVAAAAGVARATVYRYFPSRDALLDDLTRAAVREVDSHLSGARIDQVEPLEGVARAVRALVDGGDLFVLLARERSRAEPELFERQVIAPLRALFQRAQASGDVRDDLPGSRLTESLIGLIVGVRASQPPLGREDTIATVSGLFLDGARARGPRRR